MQNLWTLKALPEKDIVNSLQESLGVSELVATLLAQRGIETYIQAKKFFRPKDVDGLKGNFNKAKKELNWKPKTSFSKLVKMMIVSDLELDFNQGSID